MNVKIDKTFEKDTIKIKDKNLRLKIADCIENVQISKNIQSVINIKKLKGSNKFYRIRVGDYRIGLLINKNIVEFIRCLHRKDIYKYFPK